MSKIYSAASVTGSTEAVAGRSVVAWLEQWGRDLRLSLRSLRRAPGFSLAVFSTLALCIGPNTAILAALYGLVLKPLPFPSPEQLVVVSIAPEKSAGVASQSTLQQYLDFTAHADLFAHFALIESANSTIGEESAPVRAIGNDVSADFFAVLGIQPQLGRFFSSEEETAGRDHVLVITQAFWETKYRADPAVIGREVRMGGETFTIIGVAPRSLDALYLRTDFLKPYSHASFQLDPQRRYLGRATLIARLKPGVSQESGAAQLAALERRFHDEVASPRVRNLLDAGRYRVALKTLRNESTAAVQKSLWLLEAGAIFVLLIGAVNTANLLLARANAKRAELAIRYALGADRAALLRQMLAESVLLTLTSAVAGLAFAWGALQVLNRYLPVIARSAPPVVLEPAVAGAILLVALALGVVLGVLPFALLWRTGLRIGDARTASSSRAIRGLSSSLVVTQVAVAFVLLVGAGLLIRSFAHVMAVQPGFDAPHIVQARVALPHTYDKAEDNAAVCRRVLASIREIPGVETAAVVAYFGVGPAESFRALPIFVRSAPPMPGEPQQSAIYDPVSSGFFATMGMRLVEGRVFTEADDGRGQDQNAEYPMVVDRAFAERYFPGRSAVGQEFAFGAGPFANDFVWPRIVGVVERANLAGLESRDGLPFVFAAMGRQPGPGFNLLVRSSRSTPDLLSAMRAALRVIDPALPLYNAGTLQESLDGMLLGRRGIMLLLGVFSGLALLLAGVGLYGVLAYDVSQRTREIGIRGAIGATRGQIVALILRQGLWKSGVGLAVGLVGALAVTRYMRTLLFDVAPVDPVSFMAVPAVLLAVAALASWLPARRAASVNPVVALRAE